MNALGTLNLDAKVKWTAIAILLATPLATWIALGLAIPLHEVFGLVALAGLLTGLAWFCDRRGWIAGRQCFVGWLQFVLFTCGLTAATCLAAMLRRPLVDAPLVVWGHWLGVSEPEVFAWAQRHSALDAVLALAYQTVVPQTLLTIFLLACWRDDRGLARFLRQLMLAALAALVLFALFPAEGPCARTPPGELSPALRHYLACFHALRTDPRPDVHFFVFEGLVTFPSFHGSWAVILAAAYIRRPMMLALFGVWNAAVVVSTLTTGSHYVADVAAGLAIGLAVIVATSPFLGSETDSKD